MKAISRRMLWWSPFVLCCLPGAVAWSQAPASSEALIAALRAGGHVLVMRHAQSPRQAPAAATASKDNTGLERELDDVGKATAVAMGEALRGLRIRVGKVYSSPTFRAMQTAQLAQLPAPQAEAALGDRSGAEGATWLRNTASQSPVAGTNTVLITHAPNVMAAFDEQGQGMSDGEMLIVRPSGGGSHAIVGRIPIERWPELLAAGVPGGASRENDD
jgi:phosphohistidine phosphatase SixA